MSRKFRLLLVAAVMIAALVLPTAAFAQSATNTPWSSSITYYTPSTTGGTLVISFYAENSGTNIDVPAITLAPHKAGTLVVGGVSGLADGFKGSAVLSSDVYVVATAVQYGAGTEANNYGRMLYSGFSTQDAAPQVYIATVLQHSGSTSTVAVQNTESFDANVHVALYAVGNPTPANQFDITVPASSDAILGGGTNAHNLFPGTTFNGSLVLTGSQVGSPSTPAKLVASSQETQDAGRAAYAFEGVAAGASDIYMASALCNTTATSQTSFYAIQNTSLTTATNVTITYYDSATGANLGQTAAQPIVAGGKISVNPCAVAAMTGKSGSAVIHSSATNIIAIGKVVASNGMVTAFVGASAGATHVAAPYVRWAADPTAEWSSYIAVMNVGANAANNITVSFYDSTGTLKASQNLAAGGPVGQFVKKSTNPLAAGALTNGSFGVGGGSIEITSDQPVVVVVRATKNVNLGSTTQFAEDYNGVSVP